MTWLSYSTGGCCARPGAEATDHSFDGSVTVKDWPLNKLWRSTSAANRCWWEKRPWRRPTGTTLYSMEVCVRSMELVDTMMALSPDGHDRTVSGGHSRSKFQRKKRNVPTRSSPAALWPRWKLFLTNFCQLSKAQDSERQKRTILRCFSAKSSSVPV